MATTKTYCWRRLDFVGLEILQLKQDVREIEACATIIDAGEGQFSLQALWTLDTDWRSRSLELTQETREGTFARIRNIDADVVLTNHPTFMDMQALACATDRGRRQRLRRRHRAGRAQ